MLGQARSGEICPLEIDTDHRVPLVPGHIDGLLQERPAGVVHQRVEPAEPVYRRRNAVADTCLGLEFDLDRDRGGIGEVRMGHDLVKEAHLPVRQRHGVARARERQRCFEAEAGGRPGDQRGAAAHAETFRSPSAVRSSPLADAASVIVGCQSTRPASGPPMMVSSVPLPSPT